MTTGVTRQISIPAPGACLAFFFVGSGTFSGAASLKDSSWDRARALRSFHAWRVSRYCWRFSCGVPVYLVFGRDFLERRFLLAFCLEMESLVAGALRELLPPVAGLGVAYLGIFSSDQLRGQ